MPGPIQFEGPTADEPPYAVSIPTEDELLHQSESVSYVGVRFLSSQLHALRIACFAMTVQQAHTGVLLSAAHWFVAAITVFIVSWLCRLEAVLSRASAS